MNEAWTQKKKRTTNDEFGLVVVVVCEFCHTQIQNEMVNEIVFVVPYHTGYAHIELIKSFSSYGKVKLFVYQWNPSKSSIQNYFSQSKQIQVLEFSFENLFNAILYEQNQSNRIVVLLSSSINYSFGQTQLKFFQLIQQYFPSIVDVYSTGHCLYGCQSCNHSNSFRLAIQFTNYIRTRHLPSNSFEIFSPIIFCPSFSSEQFPFSFLSNREIIEGILSFSFAYLIKLHPLTHQNKTQANPLFNFSEIERNNLDRLFRSDRLVDEKQTNTLKLIEHAQVIVCDFDSSIPFECLYFDDHKYLFVYETIQQSIQQDDRRQFFHIFRNQNDLNQLFELFFRNQLPSKTKLSQLFFLEKYNQPDGNEIEYLSQIRQWNRPLPNLSSNYFLPDFELIIEQINKQLLINATQVTFYALGQHSQQQIQQIFFADIENEFQHLLDNFDQL